MDAAAAGCAIILALGLGTAAGISEKVNDHFYYEGFLNDADNYHLVDDAGNPVSQESK